MRHAPGAAALTDAERGLLVRIMIPSSKAIADLGVRFIFLDVDPAKEMRMEEQARAHTKKLLSYIKTHLDGVAGHGVSLP